MSQDNQEEEREEDYVDLSGSTQTRLNSAESSSIDLGSPQRGQPDGLSDVIKSSSSDIILAGMANAREMRAKEHDQKIQELSASAAAEAEHGVDFTNPSDSTVDIFLTRTPRPRDEDEPTRPDIIDTIMSVAKTPPNGRGEAAVQWEPEIVHANGKNVELLRLHMNEKASWKRKDERFTAPQVLGMLVNRINNSEELRTVRSDVAGHETPENRQHVVHSPKLHTYSIVIRPRKLDDPSALHALETQLIEHEVPEFKRARPKWVAKVHEKAKKGPPQVE